jgi:predicted DNA binding CopG/RHH family protein
MKKIPQFSSEKEEAEFWATHDATAFLDETLPVDVTFVDARPPRTRIALQFDPATIKDLKTVAQHQGTDYQTLLRAWIVERLKRELSAA